MGPSQKKVPWAGLLNQLISLFGGLVDYADYLNSWAGNGLFSPFTLYAVQM